MIESIVSRNKISKLMKVVRGKQQFNSTSLEEVVKRLMQKHLSKAEGIMAGACQQSTPTSSYVTSRGFSSVDLYFLDIWQGETCYHQFPRKEPSHELSSG